MRGSWVSGPQGTPAPRSGRGPDHRIQPQGLSQLPPVHRQGHQRLDRFPGCTPRVPGIHPPRLPQHPIGGHGLGGGGAGPRIESRLDRRNLSRGDRAGIRRRVPHRFSTRPRSRRRAEPAPARNLPRPTGAGSGMLFGHIRLAGHKRHASHCGGCQADTGHLGNRLGRRNAAETIGLVCRTGSPPGGPRTSDRNPDTRTGLRAPTRPSRQNPVCGSSASGRDTGTNPTGPTAGRRDGGIRSRGQRSPGGNRFRDVRTEGHSGLGRIGGPGGTPKSGRGGGHQSR